MYLVYITLVISCIFATSFADNTETTIKDATTIQPPKPTPICGTCKCQNATKILDCSHKGLSTWPTESDWTQINNTFIALNFNNNKFEEVNIFPNINIKMLSLSNNKIAKIEQGAFKNLQQLVSLDLSHNKLSSQALKPECFEGNYSPDFYEPIPKLTELNLSYNDLHTLDQDLFDHMPELEKLDLSHNDFKIIDHQSTVAISGIPNLKFLDMSYLGIKDMPETMLHAPRSLAVLYLEGNMFKRIPAALLHAINLKELYMSKNPLEDFVADNIFPLLPKLEVLNLTELVSIKKIGKGAFSGLTSLKKLNMDGCLHLENIHMDALSRPSDIGPLEYPPIEYINLKRNNLSSLDRELLAHWDSVDLQIGNNSWDCECALEWFLHVEYPVLKSRDKNSALQINCTSPSALKDIPFEKIYKDKNVLRCADKYGNHPENDGKLLMGLLIGLMIGIPVAMAVVMIYKNGCLGLFNNRRYDHSRALYRRAASYNDEY